MKLASRYFRARRKSLARFTSFAAITGIAAGVASLILAQALAKGFADEMQNKILANTAHISVFAADEGKINNWQKIKANLEKFENINSIAATTFENGIIVGTKTTSYAIFHVVQNPQDNASNHKSQVSSVNVQSEIEARNNQLTSASRHRPLTTAVALGAELAEKIGLKAGDEAEIITFVDQFEPKRVRVVVTQIFRTGLFEYDSTWINVLPEDFAALHGEPSFSPTILSISVENIFEADQIADQIRAKLGVNFKVLDWQEANQPLFAALSLERRAGLTIFALLIFVAALNITTTLALLVNERRFDIAVLRTCGAKTLSLILIFLLEGLFLGLAGVFLGVALGLFGCLLGNYFKIISLSAEVYSLSYIPLHIDPANLSVIILTTIVLCLAAAIYPAWRASRIKPLENLRTQ